MLSAAYCGREARSLTSCTDIGFNAAYLLEILRYMPTEEVRMTFRAPERASTLSPEGWSDPAKYLCLLMPLRLVD